VPLPPVVSASEWQEARAALLAKEKAHTRAGDALAAGRRRQPVTEIDADYVFEGPDGPRTLLELFEGRRQLIVYHFMYGPGAHGWPDAGCPGCSMFMDQLGHLAHLRARDTSFAVVSSGPLEKLLTYRARMGWNPTFYSSAGTEFSRDFGLVRDWGEMFGLSVFIRDGERIFRSYFTDGRGVEALGSARSLLDVTPLGRQEEWEDSPPGWPQDPTHSWSRRHDEYEEATQ
jgi:predicted dithiol-disulfide oxidoreductase (DUF899 family)